MWLRFRLRFRFRFRLRLRLRLRLRFSPFRYHLRLHSVQPRCFHLHQAILPIHPGYSEIMNPSRNILEYFAIFEKDIILVIDSK
jgi:hypothetical protein